MKATTAKGATMPAKPKLRSVKPTAKETIAALEAERDEWKKEAVEAEQKIQEALKVLGYDPVYYDIVEAAKQLRLILKMEDDDKRKAHVVADDYVERAAGIEDEEAAKVSAEAEADELHGRLDEALQDRAALLKHAGLTEFAWYMRGGAYVKGD